MSADRLAVFVGDVVEVVGIVVVVIGMVVATALFVVARGRSFAERYESYRRGLGRAILLGLEFLVAADIIGTVAVEPTLRNVGILAGVVLIRTVLSFALETEITGRAPWARERQTRRAESSG